MTATDRAASWCYRMSYRVDKNWKDFTRESEAGVWALMHRKGSDLRHREMIAQALWTSKRTRCPID